MRKIYYSLFVFACLSASAQKQPIQLSWLNDAQLYYNGGWLHTKSIAQCSDGSVVTTGSLTGSIDFDPGPDTVLLSTNSPSDLDTHDAFVARYSKTGKLIFAVSTKDSSKGSSVYANAVATDKEDNIYVTGNFSGTISFIAGAHKITLRTVNGSNDNFLACYGKNGNLKFAENITHTNIEYKSCHAYSIATDKNKNIYITGDFRGPKVDFDPGPDSVFKASQYQDIFFSKYDSLGNLIFVKTIGGYDDDFATKIAVDNKGNILICGYFSSSAIDFDPNAGEQILNLKGKSDLYFAKYDSAGNYVFAKNIGKSKPANASSLTVFKDNSFAITGSFSGKQVDFNPGNDSNHLLTNLNTQNNAFVAKYNAAGNCTLAFAISSGTIGFSNGNEIACDTAGNIYTIGKFSGSDVDFNPGTDSFFIKNSKSNYDYIAKYSSKGALLFAEAIGNDNYNIQASSNLTDINIANNDKIIIAGDYNTTLDVDPGNGKAKLTSQSYTSFIGRYDVAGNYLSALSPEAYTFHYNAESLITASVTDAKGNAYVCGTFSGRFDFDPGPGVYTLESYSDYESSVFFAKYTSAGKFVFAKAILSGSPLNDIAVDKDENIYLTGATFSETDFDPSDSIQYIEDADTSKVLGMYKFFIAKYSATGNLIFVKGSGNNISNYDYEINFNTIAVDDNKNIYVAGKFPYNLDFDPSLNRHVLNGNGGSIFYAKYDSLGNYIFAYKLGDEKSGGEVYDLKLNSKGNIIITGNFYGDSLDVDPGSGIYYLHQSRGSFARSAFVGKYKSNGQYINAFGIVDAGNDYNGTEIKTLAVDKDDNIYIGGKTYGKVDFDPGTKKVLLPSPAGIFFASYTTSEKLRFVKGLLPVTSYVQEQNYIQSLCLDKHNNIYVAGQFSSDDIDCDPGVNSAILKNENANGYEFTDLFIAKYDSLGNYIYSYDFDGDSLPGYNQSVSITLDNNDNINYTGFATTKLNLNTGRKKVYLQPTAGWFNLFIAQYKPTVQQLRNIINTDATNNHVSATLIKAYPNPINDKVYVELLNLKENYTTAIIQCINMRGECLLTANVVVSGHQLKKEISLPPNMQPGNYFLRVIINNAVYNSNLLLKQ